jgi:CO/xanthine dehydrogenase Mo-binding subunit
MAAVSGTQDSERQETSHPTPDDLDTADGNIFVKGSEQQSIPIAKLFIKIPYGKPGADAGPFLAEGAEIVGNATWYPAQEKSVRGGPVPKVGYAYIAQAVEVEVDVETGKVKVLNFVDFLDAGVAINPLLLKCQMEGGMGTGIGTTLFEEMRLDHGKVVNPDLTDYRVPTAKDVPWAGNVEMGLVETSFDDGPYGAKGIGEIVVTATAPAIATAIYNAIGVRFKDLPITPEKIVLELSRRNRA